MRNPGELSRELQRLRHDLNTQFRATDWRALSGSLRALASAAEQQGSLTLCLRAQSLRELLGSAGAGRGRGAPAGERVTELFHDLVSHLSHVEWTLGAASAGDESRFGLTQGDGSSVSGLDSHATLV